MYPIVYAISHPSRSTCSNFYQAIFMGPGNVHEGKRLIPVFNKIRIRKNKVRFLADISYYTFQRMI
jgi:hypothetical protein